MTESGSAGIFGYCFQALIILVMPVYSMGLINRTKAIWAGRKGPKLSQFYFDLRRLLRKQPVYSNVSSWIFQVAPWVVLATSLTAALLVPVVPGFSPIAFSYDFVYLAYLLALGRVFMIMGAIDTGSSFEGMGASREAAYSAFAEPIFFLAMGTLGLVGGASSFETMVLAMRSAELGLLPRIGLVAGLFVLLQIEAARVPVDDPNTHLELTMIHEVIILDHSGPELAAVQYAASVKFVVLAGLIAALLNPVSSSEAPWLSWGVSVGILCAVAVTIGLVESLMARFRLKVVPAYALAGAAVGFLSLAVVALRQGSAS